MNIVALQADLTYENIDREVQAACVQLQVEFNAINTNPRFVAHVAVMEELITATDRSRTALQAYEAAQVRATELGASMLTRMVSASFAASAGHPEQLQQLTQETLAMQAAVTEAQQAHLAAAQELLTREATALASAATCEESTAAMEAMRPQAQNLRELVDRKQLAVDALVDARTVHIVLQGAL